MHQILLNTITAQKIKFSIKDFFSKSDQIHSFLRIWSHLLKKSLMKTFIFCAVYQFREQQPGDINRENNYDFQSRSRGHDTFYNRNNYRPIINQANPYRTNQQPVWQFQPHKQHVPQPKHRETECPKTESSEKEEKSM